MKPKLIDTHAHLDFEQFDKDRDEVIGNARKEGVWVITSGVGPVSIRKTLEIIEKHDNVFATFGCLPEEFDDEVIDETIHLIRGNKDGIVGIGEVGLDYYWVKEQDNRVKEEVNFQRFIDLAEELSLPLVIHSRDAESRVIDMLRDVKSRVLLHCFGGDLNLVREAVNLGFLISIPTSITYSKQKRALAKELPIESFVLETDAPFLSPAPKTRNEPTNIKESARKIAEIRNISLKEVEEATTRNAIEFFNLKL